MVLGGTILGTFIVSLIVFVVVTIFSNLSSANNMQLCYGDLHYVLAENDEYISYQERNRVIIKDRNGGQVVSFDPQEKEIWPDQMVLGKEHFYMLEWDDTTTETFRDAIIMQFLLCMISYVFRHPVQIRLLYKIFHLHRDKAYPSRPCSVLYI